MSIFRIITFLVLCFIVYKVFVAVKDFEVGLDKRVEKVEALGLGKEDEVIESAKKAIEMESVDINPDEKVVVNIDLENPNGVEIHARKVKKNK